jgi:hypothetical protein
MTVGLGFEGMLHQPCTQEIVVGMADVTYHLPPSPTVMHTGTPHPPNTPLQGVGLCQHSDSIADT